jgi:gluconokinase
MSSRIRDLGLRSPYDKTGGLVYFGRMLDKIRSHARGELPVAYLANLGKGFDEKCTTFLRVSYELGVEYVHADLADEAILQTCFAMGRQPSEAEIYVWNEFMRKRGWHDEVSELLESQKKGEAMLSRSEIQTMFQFMDADEGRLVNDNYTKASPVRKRIAIPAKEWPVRPEDKDTLGTSGSVGSPIEQRR